MSEDDETSQASANRISHQLDRNHPYSNLPPELAESRITIDNFPRAHNNLDQQSLVSDLIINSGSSSFTASTAVSNLSEHPAIVETDILSVEETRRIQKQKLIRAGEKDPDIFGMSYNSARDELFLADFENEVVRAMRVYDNAGDLRDVYRAPHDTSPFIWSVRATRTHCSCVRATTFWWH